MPLDILPIWVYTVIKTGKRTHTQDTDTTRTRHGHDTHMTHTRHGYTLNVFKDQGGYRVIVTKPNGAKIFDFAFSEARAWELARQHAGM